MLVCFEMGRKASFFIKEYVLIKADFLKGMKDGIPIALGYLSVSFGFGIMAVAAGLTVAQAVAISASNLTSAGQAAGVGIIAAGGAMIEMVLTQLVINIRYSLMGLSLSQKLDDRFTTGHRLLASFGITDEIFAVSYAQEGKLRPAYMYGLIFISFLGWTIGTLLGAAAGNILPAAVTDAMGIVLYGMFLAIVIPVAREKKSVLLTAVLAIIMSCLFQYVFTAVSSGFAIILSAIVAAAVAAWRFPVDDEPEEGGAA